MTEQQKRQGGDRLDKQSPPAGTGPAATEPASDGPDPVGQAGTRPAGAKPRRRGNRRATSAGATGLVPVKAKEDDPRVWGDSPEDRDSWLLEQRPPHWG